MVPPHKIRRVLVFTTFMNFLGLALAFPLFTPLCLDPSSGLLPQGTPEGLRVLTLGLLIGIFPLAAFFTAPVLGPLSDHWGRKPLILGANLVNILLYPMTALGILLQNFPLVLVSRLLQGAVSGSTAAVQASMADLSSPERRSRDFGALGAAFGVSLALGPALGGFLSDPHLHPGFNLATPFWLAGIFAGLNGVQIALFLPETRQKIPETLLKLHPFMGLRSLVQGFQDPRYRKILWGLFFYVFGFNFYSQFFQTYLNFKFQATQSQVGLLFMVLGLGSIVAQAVLVPRLARKFSPAQILPWTLGGLGVGFLGYLLVPQFWWLFAYSILIPLFNGITSPNISARISSLGDAQGRLMGLQQGILAAGQFLAPLAGGFLVALTPTAALWASGGFVLIGAGFLWHSRKNGL